MATTAMATPPLQQAIAAHHGVDPECVVESAGTSMANHLAMAAIIEPGDEVLIEHPAYGPILDIAQYLQANVKRFRRVEENGWAIDPEEVRRCITPKTRLIVITNLHNPTSVLTPESVLREIGDIARSAGALVLVDEVYLDAVYDDTPRTSFHLGPEFVVTSSLTKVYGVSGLRCGWILAQPDLAWKMRRLNDLYSATPVHPGELLSVAAFKHLDLLRERARPHRWRPIANCSAIFSNNNRRFLPLRRSGAPHHSPDCSAETRTLFSSVCGLSSTPQQFPAASSKCLITFASGWA